MLTPELASAAISAARCDPPAAFPVAWRDGVSGAVLATVSLPASALSAELRERLLVPREKLAGEALLPAAVAPERTRLTRGAVESVSAAVVDCDGGGPMGAAIERARDVGLGGWWFPSASAPLGPAHLATRWRWLLPLAEGTSAELYARMAGALHRALVAVLGVELDGSTFRPEALTFVHPTPTVGGRAPCDLVELDGAALDVAELAEHAARGGWWTPREHKAAVDARAAGVRDGATLVAVLEGAGLVLGAPDRRGWAPLRCPGERWHGGRAKTRRDTSTVVNVYTGACVCSHDHSAAPAAERGPAKTSRVLAWLRAEHPELAPALALARDAGSLGAAREVLAAVPFGEAPRRVVALAGVAEATADALALAVLRGRLVLHTPTVGAGKSTALGRALARVLRDGELAAKVDAAAPLASGGVKVKDRAAIPDAVASVLRAGLPVRVYTPVHEVLARSGEHECTHHVPAERLYRKGASARASLCHAVPAPMGLTAKCERFEGCRARDAWVPWVLGDDGAPHAAPWHTPPLGETWVAVAPAASAAQLGAVLRVGSPLVVDESDVALAPVTAELGPEALVVAEQWAASVAAVKVNGLRPGDCHAPRIIAQALTLAARASGAEALAAVPPANRAAWCITALGATMTAKAAKQSLAQWVDAADDTPAPALAALVVAKWADGATIGSVRPRHGQPLPEGGASALRALARWASGCHARAVTHDPEQGPVLALAWRSDAAELCAGVLARGGGVLAMDATGDPAIARAAVGAELVEHDPVRVDGGADVRRVLVHTSRAGRRALAPHGGVQWDTAGDALRAALGALRATWREGFGRGEGFGVAPRALALACEALAAVGPDAPEAAVREALAASRAWPKLGEHQRERVAVAACSAPADVRRVLAELGEHGAVRWTWYGSTEARGSNEHRHRAWSLTLGDARPGLESARSAAWAMTGVEPTDTAVREALASAAARAHEQAHGRLRALQRDGARLVMLHVGRVAPLGWHQLPEAPVVVSPAGARAWGAAVAPVADAATSSADALAQAVADTVAPVADTAHPDVRAAAAAGWTLGDIQRAAGRSRDTVRAWWRGESTPRAQADRATLRALAAGEGTPTLRAALRRLCDGRGFDRVWSGSAGVYGLSRRLEALGVTVGRTSVERWSDVASRALAPEVVGAIARVLPELYKVFPPVRALPEALTRRWPPAELAAATVGHHAATPPATVRVAGPGLVGARGGRPLFTPARAVPVPTSSADAVALAVADTQRALARTPT